MSEEQITHEQHAAVLALLAEHGDVRHFHRLRHPSRHTPYGEAFVEALTHRRQ